MNKCRFLPLVLLFCVLWLAGCASLPEQKRVTEEKTDIRLETNSYILSEVRNLISIGSPAALEKASYLLLGSAILKSADGKNFSYIILNMYDILYPYLLKPEFPGPAAAEDVYADAFSEIRKGNLPGTAGGEATFLTQLIAPLAVFFSRDKNLYSESREICTRTEEMFPDSLVSRYIKAYISEKEFQYEEALRGYQEILKADPLFYPADIGTAGIHVEEGRYSEALGILLKIEEKYGGDAGLFCLIGRTFLGLNDIPAASLYSDRSLLEEEKSGYLFLRARILIYEEKYDLAAKLLSGIFDRSELTPDYFLGLTELAGKSGHSLTRTPLEILSQGYEAFPGNREIAAAYGKELIQMNRSDEGFRLLEDILDKNPGDPVREYLISAASEQGAYERAEKYLKGLDTRKASPELLKSGYSVYSFLGDREKALNFAEVLSRRFPDAPEYTIPLIEELIRRERNEDALAVLRKVISSVSSPVLRSRLLHLESTIVSSLEERIAFIQEALIEDKNNIPALRDLAKIYAQRGDYPKAVRYIKQASLLEPEDEEIAVLLEQYTDVIQKMN